MTNGHGATGSTIAARYFAKGVLEITLILPTIFFLSACETIPPPPQIVHVSVPTPCLPSTPLLRPKTFTDAELATLDDFKFTLAIFSDRRALLDYSAELEAVLSACK